MKWSEESLQALLQERDVEYLCEVVISENELASAARFVRSRIVASDLERHPILLAVFAVSVAYHDYDEDGFWAHFFRRIQIEQQQPIAQYVGSIIEDWLKRRNFITGDREGAFRFVGPILEQSGITKRYLKRYIQILQDMAQNLGWDGLRTISFSTFQGMVARFTGSRFLIGFLKEKEGWEFSRGVARNYIQYRGGILEKQELSALKGYHPDFWEKLMAEIPPERSKSTRASLPPRPRFIFDPEFGQLALMFDSEFVRKGRYEIDGSAVRKPLLPIDTPDMLREEYSVVVIDDKERRIPLSVRGWNPMVAPEAFFALGRGYVPISSVGRGEYYLLTPAVEGISAGIGVRVTHDLGLVSLPGDGPPYKALCVAVEETGETPVRQDPFEWIAPAAGLPGACDLCEVFVGCSPRVRIVKKDLFVSKAVALVFDVGEGPKRIDVEKALRIGDELEIPAPIPGRGTIWAEPIRRAQEFSGKSEIGRRYFCVLPPLSLSWPAGLYKDGDEPEIVVRSDADVRLQFREGARRTDDRRWITQPGATMVEGELVVGRVRVGLAHRVNRARLRLLPGGGDVVAVEQFVEAFRLEASGVPGERAVIAVEMGGVKSLGDVGPFGASGSLVFSSDAIRDAAMSFDSPVGRFAIVRNGQGAVPTSTWLMNFGRFIDCVLEDGSHKWATPPGFSTNVTLPVEQLVAALKEGFVDSMSFLESVPKSRLGVMMLEAYATSATLEGVATLDMARETVAAFLGRLPEATKVGLRWVLQARSCCEAEGDGEAAAEVLLEDLMGVAWRPMPKRWREAFDAVVATLRWDSELLPLCEEWLPEVRGHVRPGYKSRLGSMPSGDTLTDGWRAYLKGDFPSAFKKAVFASEGARSPIRELAVLLAYVAIIRAGRFGHGEEASFAIHKRLAYHLETVRLVDALLSGKIETPLQHQASTALPIECLPLREEDQSIFERRFLQKSYRTIIAERASGGEIEISLCAHYAGKEGEQDVEARLRGILKAKGKLEFPLQDD